MDLADIRALVSHEIMVVDTIIQESLESKTDFIQQLGTHIIQSGGKRLRPLLVLLGAGAFHYQGDAHLKLAATIELIHTATLLHDDVVDSSELRRGKQTANALWGNPASVLVGDFLYSRAFQIMVQINNWQVLSSLAKATNIIAQGEILQLLNCNNDKSSEEQCLEIIKAKTGSLFATAAKLGAILTERSEKEINAMENYGMHLGMAFQLIDDTLDYSNQSDTIGKNPGDDLAEGKPTIPLLYALRHSTEEEAICIREAIQKSNRENIDRIRYIIETSGAIPYTYQVAKEHVEAAVNYLSEIPKSPYRNALSALAKFSLTRDH